MSASSPEPAPGPSRTRRRLRRSSRLLLRVGAVLLAVSLVLTLVGGLTTRSLQDDLTTNSAELVDGTGTVALSEGAERTLYVTGGLVAPGELMPTPVEDIRCTVTDPNRQDQPVSHLSDRGERAGIDTPLARFQVLGTFRAGAAGEHIIECTGLGVVVAPEVSATSVVLRLGALILGSIGTFLGVTFLVIGGVLRLLTRRGDGADEHPDRAEDDLEDLHGRPPEQGAEEWWEEESADRALPSEERHLEVDLGEDYVELSDEELQSLSEEEIEQLVASGALIFVDEDDQLVVSQVEDEVDETERGDTYR